MLPNANGDKGGSAFLGAKKLYGYEEHGAKESVSRNWFHSLVVGKGVGVWGRGAMAMKIKMVQYAACKPTLVIGGWWRQKSSVRPSDRPHM